MSYMSRLERLRREALALPPDPVGMIDPRGELMRRVRAIAQVQRAVGIPEQRVTPAEADRIREQLEARARSLPWFGRV